MQYVSDVLYIIPLSFFLSLFLAGDVLTLSTASYSDSQGPWGAVKGHVGPAAAAPLSLPTQQAHCALWAHLPFNPAQVNTITHGLKHTHSSLLTRVAQLT